MSRFLVLYRSPVTTAEQMDVTPQQAKAGMDLWMGWAKQAGNALIDFGMPLGEGKNVTVNGAADSTADIRGYSILEAESVDDAVTLLKDHPHFHSPGESSIEVLEFVAVPGI